MLILRNLVVVLWALAAMTLGVGTAAAAPFSNAYVTANVNLRAGPDTSYPAVATMRAGDTVTIYGCLSGWSWCDIVWRGNRGWAAGRYLQVLYHNHRRPIIGYGGYLGLPFITFSIGTYWGQYYHGRPWYNQLPNFQKPGWNKPPHHGKPPFYVKPPYNGKPPFNGKPGCKPGQKWINGSCK